MTMTTNTEDNESAMTLVMHPKTVKEIFLDCTASFDYELHVSVDGKELQWLDPNVYYNGHEVAFYWRDSFECLVGSRVTITLLFWYKDKMVRYHMGSENVRRDEMSQATEHWTFGEDEEFHIDPEDEDGTNFLEMLNPEWRRNRYNTISIPGVNDGRVIYGRDEIIDVDFTEVESEEPKNGYRQKQLECRNDEETV